MTEELLAALQAEMAAAASSAKVSDEDVVSAFYADPDVAEIKADLRRTKATQGSGEADDPQGDRSERPRNYDRKTKELEEELERAWRRLRPAIVAQLSHTANDDPTLVQAEAELRGLKAKESALRKQREQLRLDHLRQLRQEQDQLAAQFGPGHEKLVAVKQQIAQFENIPEETLHSTQPQTGALLSAIEQGLKSVETMRAEIEERFRRDLTESKKSEIDLLAESNLRNNLERQRTLFNSVVDQLKQAQLVSDYGSVSAQVLNPPTASESRPSMGPGLMMALLMGLGVGGGIAFVADLLDARLRSVSEIRKVVDLRVLGLIPQHTRGQLDSDFAMGLMSHTTPRSLMAEAYKSVRTSLDQIRRNLNAQVLLITSPQSGDGKSTTASNLAISLAHAGRRVLLIDADLRRPSQHLIHGLRRSPGLTHILKDVLPFHRVVQPTLIDNLDFLATGSEVANPAELLASPRLNLLLEEVRLALRRRHLRLLPPPRRDRFVDHRIDCRRYPSGRPGFGHPTSRPRADPGAPQDPGNPGARDGGQRHGPRAVWLRLRLWLRLWLRLRDLWFLESAGRASDAGCQILAQAHGQQGRALLVRSQRSQRSQRNQRNWRSLGP